jgi:hypothetical protein
MQLPQKNTIARQDSPAGLSCRRDGFYRSPSLEDLDMHRRVAKPSHANRRLRVIRL